MRGITPAFFHGRDPNIVTTSGAAVAADTLNDAKTALRESAARRRDAIDPATRAAAAENIVSRFHAAVAPASGTVISGFWPAKGEIDVRPLLEDLHGRGHLCALPVVAGRGDPLAFRAWTPETEMVAGSFGIATPPPGAATVEPDVLLVPLLAFDRRGGRLGWGAGFYDRTLAALRARKRVTAVGVAFAAQEVAEVPRDVHDEPLDWVLTERAAIGIAR